MSEHLQHGMVEMRWIMQPMWAGSSFAERRLQYRYVSYDWARPHDNFRWSEWKDVPIVQEGT